MKTVLQKLLRATFWMLLFTFFTCQESNEKRKVGGSSVTTEETEAIKEVKETTSDDPYIESIITGTEASESAESGNAELGVYVSSPKGLLAINTTPKINIQSIRNSFSGSLPGNAVVLGQGATIDVDAESKYFNDNLNIKMNVPKTDLKDNVAFAIHTVDADGNDSTQIVTQGDVQIHTKDDSPLAELTFKAGAKNIDIQMVDLQSLKLSDSEVYFPRPRNPQQVECIADGAYSAYLSWGVPGGSVAAYKIIQFASEESAVSDIGCEGTSTFPELTGTARSYSVANLEPLATYYYRICSLNNRTPPDHSPGVVCKVETPAPNIPTIQVAIRSGGDLIYGKKSDGAWALETIGSNISVNSQVFEIDKNNAPYIAWRYSFDIYKYTKLENGSLITTNLTSSLFIPTEIENAASYYLWRLDSLLIDNSLNPILYYEFNHSNGYLQNSIISKTATSWQYFYPLPYSIEGTVGQNAMALDENGGVHLFKLYIQSYADGLAYQSKVGSSWQGISKLKNANCVDTKYYDVAVTTDSSGDLHGSFICEKTNTECGVFYFSETNVAQAIEISSFPRFSSGDVYSCSIASNVLSIATNSNKKPKILFQKNNPNQKTYTINVAESDSGVSTFATTDIVEINVPTVMSSSNYQYTIRPSCELGVDYNDKWHVVCNEVTALVAGFGGTQMTTKVTYFTNLSNSITSEVIKSASTSNINAYSVLGVKINGMKSKSARFP